MVLLEPYGGGGEARVVGVGVTSGASGTVGGFEGVASGPAGCCGTRGRVLASTTTTVSHKYYCSTTKTHGYHGTIVTTTTTETAESTIPIVRRRRQWYPRVPLQYPRGTARYSNNA